MQHYANFCSKSLSYFNPFGVSNYNILNIVRRAHQKKTFILFSENIKRQIFVPTKMNVAYQYIPM